MRYYLWWLQHIFIKMIYFCEALFYKKDDQCPYCGSSKHQLLAQKMRIIDIYRCLDCLLVWSNPIFRFPSFYDILYREKDMITNIPSDRKLNNLIKENFINTEKDYNRLIIFLKEKYNIKKALDFGSSWGYFMMQMAALGIESAGVEISDKRRNFGIRKLNLRIEKDCKAFIDNNERFDIIFSIHTIEHLKDVRLVFRSFYQLLSGKGILFLQVPKIDLEKKNTDFKLIGAVHPLGFSRHFFQRNLPAEGFDVEIHEGYGRLTGEFICHRDDLIVLAQKA